MARSAGSTGRSDTGTARLDGEADPALKAADSSAARSANRHISAAERSADGPDPGADRCDAAPLRVAFVGQSVYFRQCALERPQAGLHPVFLDFRAGAPLEPLRAELERIDPDVVLVFRPEIVPEGAFSGLRAVTIGYLTEPLPRSEDEHHADLRARLAALGEVDPENFDRIVSFDPLIAETAGRLLPVWRSLPLPVADSIFMDLRPRQSPPRLIFIGRSTEHREHMLAPLKRGYPIVHVGHGLFGSQLSRLLGRSDVQLNLHNNPYPTFENRVCIALAAGHLVISEPLSPSHGLRAGVDYLVAQTPEQLAELVDELATDHGAHLDVQASGRAAAERFRASRVYPQLLRDVIEGIAADGGRREHDRAALLRHGAAIDAGAARRRGGS